MTKWVIFWVCFVTVKRVRIYGLIDNLNLTYNGNQLESVYDNATNSVFGNGMEFKDVVHETVEYAYDKNGNLTKDLNKNITELI